MARRGLIVEQLSLMQDFDVLELQFTSDDKLVAEFGGQQGLPPASPDGAANTVTPRVVGPYL